MPSKKIYYPENEEQSPELQICINGSHKLFVCISEFDTHSTDLSIELSLSDAKEIVTQLAYDLELLYDDPSRDFLPTWQG